jgi:hypothetical protein
MKQILTGATTFLLILFQACSNYGTVQIDISGTWVNLDGAMMVFRKDSSFVGKQLPAEYFTFFTTKEVVEGKRINGSGVWKIADGPGYKEVKLTFRKRDGQDMYGAYSVYIADEKPSPYLFVWKEEEGGERYKFTKK